jgi:hypothetical protein
MKFLDDDLWVDMADLLIQLARRNNDNVLHWCSYNRDPQAVGEKWNGFCNICESWIGTEVFYIRAHGWQHLKDKNLLPFI